MIKTIITIFVYFLIVSSTTCQKAIEVNFLGEKIKIAKKDIFELTPPKIAPEDSMVVSVDAILQSLESYGEEPRLLNFELKSMPKSIKNLWVFSINSKEDIELFFQVTNLRFISMIEHKISIKKGMNYYALNVKLLENGSYNFRLLDKKGGERNQNFDVKNDKR